MIREAIFPLEGPNGIGLSPDERTLYVAETPTGRVWAYPSSSPGEIDESQLPCHVRSGPITTCLIR